MNTKLFILRKKISFMENIFEDAKDDGAEIKFEAIVPKNIED